MDTTVQVRWNDEDAFGHVNNAVYLTYAEHGRDRMLGALLGAATLDDLVIARVEIDYRAEITHVDEQVVVTSVVTGHGRSSVRTAERVTRPGGTLAAELATVMVARDRDTGAARAWTEAERLALEAATT